MLPCLSALEHFYGLTRQTFDCEGERLEEYIIGVSRMYYGCDGPADITSQWIRARLDFIANIIRDRFPSQQELSTDQSLKS
jgi:hypothetical protein